MVNIQYISIQKKLKFSYDNLFIFTELKEAIFVLLERISSRTYHIYLFSIFNVLIYMYGYITCIFFTLHIIHTPLIQNTP